MNSRLTRVKYLSTATITSVIVSLVLASIAFACPDAESVETHASSHSAGGEAAAQEPCNGPKPEICASIRDSMLSLRTDAFHLPSPAQHAGVSASIKTESRLGSEHFQRSLAKAIAFHPVFKLPLPCAYLVLRI